MQYSRETTNRKIIRLKENIHRPCSAPGCWEQPAYIVLYDYKRKGLTHTATRYYCVGHTNNFRNVHMEGKEDFTDGVEVVKE